ncbi:MAG: RHS repeat-associated core domain-containing protein [Planctomycetia bacterium]|nr:RHS repeat-associated core domain-containing protein [Planctomycetia bacterium]
MKAERIAPDGAGGTDTTTLHTAKYDALGRRVEKVISNSGDLDGTFRFWYNGQQMIERRDGSSNVLMQVYYGTQYIDEIVAIKLEHGYAVVSQDANYNVTTLTDLAGRVLERVFYTEYGQPILEAERYFGDYDADGDVDSTDDGFLGSGQTCWGTATGTCRVFDFNGDGTLDAADETVMTALVAAPTTNRVHHNRRTSPAGNLFLHQGLVYDAEIGAYQNRAREYDPDHQRFAQRDPLAFRNRIDLAYEDGLSLYGYLGQSPVMGQDPLGLQCINAPINLARCWYMWFWGMFPFPPSPPPTQPPPPGTHWVWNAAKGCYEVAKYAIPGSEFVGAAHALPEVATSLVCSELRKKILAGNCTPALVNYVKTNKGVKKHCPELIDLVDQACP